MVLIATLRTVSDPPQAAPAEFTSDAVIHPDLGTELGTVPDTYANYQMVRSPGAGCINLNTTMGFTLGSSTTLVYGHISRNDHDTYKPSWLTGANGWSFSGNTGTVTMPDPLTASGTISVAVHYYEKTGVSGAFTYAGYRSANWDEIFGHYVGVFLVPAGVSISAVNPAHMEVISDISSSYSPPERDTLYWDETAFSSYGAPDNTAATSLSELATDANAASAGNEIALADNVSAYNDEGRIDITVNGTAANPIIIRPESAGGATLSGTSRIRLVNCDYVILEGFNWDGFDASPDTFEAAVEIDADCTWCVVRDCKVQNTNTTNDRSVAFRNKGKYCRVTRCDVIDHDDQWRVVDLDPNEFSYMRIDHVDLDDIGTAAESGGGAEPFQVGTWGSSNADQPTQEDNIRIDHCRVRNFNRQENETFGLKSGGAMIINNVLDDQDGQISPRAAANYLVAFNHFLNTTSGYNNNNILVSNGVDYTSPTTDGAFCSNTCDEFHSGNGRYQLIEDNVTSGVNRLPGNRILVVSDFTYGADDQIFKLVQEGAGTWTANVKFEGCAWVTTSTLIDLNSLSWQLDWTFSGCVADYATDPNVPTGVTKETSTFANRGDGVQIPTSGNRDAGINTCLPGRLESTTIANLGASW